MLFDAERRRGKLAECAGTSRKIVDAVARAAVEVVVVVETGALIAAGLAREFHLREPSFRLECADRAVHRRHPKLGCLDARFGEDLVRRQRPCGAFDGALNRIALPRASLHRYLVAPLDRCISGEVFWCSCGCNMPTA